MYTAALLALAPIAAQAAAQSTRWPVFNLRANITEQYDGAVTDSRGYWHNAPIGESNTGDVGGPLFDNSECSPVRAGLNDHGKYLCPPIWTFQNVTLISSRPVLQALHLLPEIHHYWHVRTIGDDGR
jgi:hypothetical protein